MTRVIRTRLERKTRRAAVNTDMLARRVLDALVMRRTARLVAALGLSDAFKTESRALTTFSNAPPQAAVPRFSDWPHDQSGVLGVGTDLIHVPRLRDLLVRQTQRERRGADDVRRSSGSIASGLARFSNRILTHAEREELAARQSSSHASTSADVDVSDETLRWLAVRWAAKEAAYKALFPHLTLRWKDVEIVKANVANGGSHLQSKKPCLQLLPSALGAAPLRPPRLHLSISHDGDFVLAFVVAEQPPSPI
ncbi:hypothetical protein OC842_002212 [Tilletia horrida]|uniref:4'-phosphopantetheinyl transferase domain-containing protein n=1 Tax=Tilletia horrida TaxID=155126 RepID=A0AAN6JLU2_9BASI|nr:hypothetical protein OC842_002212 [Tilletia horrida]